ncbi:hypothetical protein [Janibacter hoylei]|uniref:hypothetical protein n=1 Tax=Janibacter hoylei TaxID=364298 RepID=UPI002492C062|nr:hypothetical protein [Janibacter hoylei]
MKVKGKIGRGAGNSALLNAISGVVAFRSVGILFTFFAMPLYFSIIPNRSTLGVWFALLGVLTWILNLDLGLSNGLRHYAVVAISEDDNRALRRYVSSTYAGTVGSSMLIFLIGAVLIWWHRESANQNDFSSSVDWTSTYFMALAGVSLQLALRPVVSLLYALQRPVIPAALGCISNVLIVLLLWLGQTMSFGERGIVFAAASYTFATVVPLIVATAYLFRGELHHARPALSEVRAPVFVDVLRIGFGFLLLQLLYVLLTSSNATLIAVGFGAESSVDFQVYSRPYVAFSMFFTIAIAPVWSAVTKAVVEGKRRWVVNAWRLLLGGWLVAILAMACFTVFAEPFFSLWLHGVDFEVDDGALWFFAASASTVMLVSIVSALANGARLIVSQAVLFSVGLALKLAIVRLAATGSGEWTVVVLSDVLSFAPYIVIQSLLVWRFLKSRAGVSAEP